MDQNKFKEIIQSCHLNFLIGSGASRPLLGILGEIEKYLTAIETRPESIEKKIVLISLLKHYFDMAIRPNFDVLTKDIDSDTTLANYSVFLKAINNILIHRKSSILNKQVNLFTTNMDILLEKVLEGNNFEFNDGFAGRMNPSFSLSNYRKTISKRSSLYDNQSEIPLFNIYKLHGSLNWKEVPVNASESCIGFDNTLSIIEKISSISLAGLVDELYDGSGIKTVDRLFEDADGVPESSSHNEFKELYDKILMINPTKEKFKFTTLNYTYYELLRMYSNELEKENSVLFVFGFSFADEHIREITVRVANSNPTLKVCIFAYNDNAESFIQTEIRKSNSLRFDNIYYFPRDSSTSWDLSSISTRYFEFLSKELDKART